MPTSPEKRIGAAAPASPAPPAVKRLGVIAGSGDIPARLVAACEEQGIELFIVGFEGRTDLSLLTGRKHILTRPGAAGHIIKILKAQGIHDLVMIGSMRRPSLMELKPDWWAVRFFARVGLKALGDDGLLKAIRSALAEEGFTVHGVHAFVGDLLAPEGVVGRVRPDQQDWADIERGLEVALRLGALDVGQAVIVQEGLVLGVEAIEGTDALIQRCATYARTGRGPVLVKTCKPGQDIDLDLPTIGPETVKVCAAAGFRGIVVHAGRSLLLEAGQVAELANAHGLFVVGVDPARLVPPHD